MQSITTIGLDLAKSVFQIHGVDGDGAIVVRRAFTMVIGRAQPMAGARFPLGEIIPRRGLTSPVSRGFRQNGRDDGGLWKRTQCGAVGPQ